MKQLKPTELKIMKSDSVIKQLSLCALLVISMLSIAAIAQESLSAQGQRLLDNGDFQAAQRTFKEAIRQNEEPLDAALYWLAYAQVKSKQLPKAMSTLQQLKRKYPESQWLDDAEALQVEIQDKRGESIDVDDEELKLYALNSLMNSSSEKAMGILKNIINSNNSARIKERALFILSQRNDPEAFSLIESIAKQDDTPVLQEKAIHMLGVSGSQNAVQSLKNVYQNTSRVEVKRRVIHSFMVARESEELFSLARTESDPELKAEAIHMIGIMSNPDVLLKMYGDESFKDFKDEIIHSIAIGDGADELYEIINTEKDPSLQKSAIEKIGITRPDEDRNYLPRIYAEQNNADIRRAVIQAMMIQSNASGLIEIIKREDDPQLKREALRTLSIMNSDEALDYFDEILQGDQ